MSFDDGLASSGLGAAGSGEVSAGIGYRGTVVHPIYERPE